MTSADNQPTPLFPHRHLLGIEGLSPADITSLLDLADTYVEQNRQVDKTGNVLRGRTQINLFFEASTRTQSSFELAGKRLGADVMNMSVSSSSVKKGETLIDTAVTLGLNYPYGPLAYGDRVGGATVLRILRTMCDYTADMRYRPSLWLARRAALGVSLLTEE